MNPDPLVGLYSEMLDPARRRDGARALAVWLGAEDAVLFTQDRHVGALLPAPGFPQTLPRGREWRTLVEDAVLRGSARGELPLLDPPHAKRPAFALAGTDGSILVLLGGTPRVEAAARACEMLPLLAGTLSFERDAADSRAQVRVAEEAAAHASSLAEALDRARRDLQRAHDTVLEERERFDVTLSSIGDCVIATDSAGTVTFVNPVAEALTGWSRAEAIGRPLEDAFRIVNEETSEPVESPVARVIGTGKVVGLANHTILIARDGTRVAIDDSAAPLKAADGSLIGVVLVFRDVSERRRAERLDAVQFAVARALADSTLFGEASPAILAAVGECSEWDLGTFWEVDGNVLRWIDGWQRADASHFQFQEQSRGRVFSRGEGLPGRVWSSGTPVWIPDLAGDGAFLRAGLAAAAGLIAGFAFPIALQGEVLGVLEFFGRRVREPDERLMQTLMTVGSQIALFMKKRRAEEDRARLLQREREARAQAEEANRLKDDFLATISHELRTPLHAILGWARLLRSGKLDAASTSRAVETIERNATAQAKLIGDILDVSSIVMGKVHLDLQAVDLSLAIESAADSVRPTAEAKGVRIRTDAGAEAIGITGDADRLQQVLWNLLSNAVKFTPKEGVVTVTAAVQPSNEAQITVSDTGQGIGPEFLPYVFDRFRQGDGSSTRAHGGLGLGLAIVRHLVELHGGRVSAESGGVDAGSTFIVRLPLRLPSASNPAELNGVNEKREAREEVVALSGVRVLVVEDEPDARELLATVLARSGAEIRTAGSAREGLDLVGSWRPDVLVSDIALPGEDGHDLMRKVRLLDPGLGGLTPAAAVSAYTHAEDRTRALSAGYQTHLPKPVDAAELVDAVARLAATRPREPESE